jgi:cell division protein FtsW (lipid II flippase)
MMVAGGVSGKSLWTIGLTVVLLAGVLVVDKPYRLNRFMSHGDRWSETKIDSIGYQTTRSETALAAGGLTGVGFGQGRAKHSLPEPTNDFIMATIGEEIGLVGSLMVMGLLGLIVWRLYHQGVRRVDRFERLFLVGCATWIGVQTVANIVVANGAVPVMGVPLPFFSAGGSSLAALWIAIGAAQAIVMSPNVKVESGSASDSADPQPSMRRAAFLR